MAVQTVFSDNLDPSNFNLSERFSNAIAFYIDAPLIDSELEIDVFLQVFFPTADSERVRVHNLGKISESSVLLNVTNTESVVAIPEEYLDTGLEMALLFLASSTTYLEAFVVTKNYTLTDLYQRIEAIESSSQLVEQFFELIPISELQAAFEIIKTLEGSRESINNSDNSPEPEPEPEPEPLPEPEPVTVNANSSGQFFFF